ncbi:MAG TPA: glycoside hydrolase [Actinomycetota bacterium]|nr:glycoside hydrolase [Actinomycetota bacterium]
MLGGPGGTAPGRSIRLSNPGGSTALPNHARPLRRRARHLQRPPVRPALPAWVALMLVAVTTVWAAAADRPSRQPAIRVEDALRPADRVPGKAVSTPPPAMLPGATTPGGVTATTDADATGAGVGAVVSAAPAQAIDGFGVSGAWWPGDLVHFSAAAQQQVSSMLFGQNGIASSIYRYNIGAGGVGNPNRASPTFLIKPGSYDWSRDVGGRTFLRAAAAAGVPSLVGFANSAPGAWTTNGKPCGGHLQPGAEQAYGRYLADVVRHLHDLDGVKLDYVSPMNEPDSSFDQCYQEGMVVPTAQRSSLVQALDGALADRAPWAGVMADESSHVRQFVPEAGRWLHATGTTDAVDVLATHDYDFATAPTLNDARDLAAEAGKPLWMTEVCCNHGMRFAQGFDPTMTGAIWLANTITQNLTQASATGFAWWTALSPTMGCDPRQTGCATTRNGSGWDDGLVYYDGDFRSDGNESLYPTKRLWVLGNFSRFVRPGAVRHAVGGVPSSFRVLAFRSPGEWVVVVVDEDAPGSGPAGLPVTLPDDGATLGAPAAWRTDGWKNLESAPAPGLAGHTLTVSVPPRSVTTYVIPAS